MRSNTLALFALALAFAQGGYGQGIASIDPLGFEDDGLAGNIVGTGADGTTYVLTGTQFGGPITLTLVEDAFHVSETADVPTGANTLHIGVECQLGNGQALCTEVIHVGDVATTTVITGENEPTGVPIGSGAVGGSSGGTQQQSTITALSSSTTASTTGTSSSESVLPPVVSTLTTPSSSTGGSTLSLNPSQTASAASSSRLVAPVGMAMLGAILAFLL